MIDYQKHRARLEKWKSVKDNLSDRVSLKNLFDYALCQDATELLDKAEQRDEAVRIASRIRDIAGPLVIGMTFRHKIGDEALINIFMEYFEKMDKWVSDFPDEFLEDTRPIPVEEDKK